MREVRVRFKRVERIGSEERNLVTHAIVAFADGGECFCKGDRKHDLEDNGDRGQRGRS